MKVKQTSPIGELLSRKLLGLEGVPTKMQTKMIHNAITAAIAHETTLLTRIKSLENELSRIIL